MTSTRAPAIVQAARRVTAIGAATLPGALAATPIPRNQPHTDDEPQHLPEDGRRVEAQQQKANQPDYFCCGYFSRFFHLLDPIVSADGWCGVFVSFSQA
jgi:hypothetical protein